MSDSLTDPWIVALSMGFARQECWSGLPFPSPGDLPNPGIKPASPELAGRIFTTSSTWEALQDCLLLFYLSAPLAFQWVRLPRWLRGVSASNVGDLGLIPGSGRSPGEGNGKPLQHSCLENPMNSGTWQATVHRIARVGHHLVTKPLKNKPLKNKNQNGFYSSIVSTEE